MQKSMKIVIGVTAAAVLAVGGLAGYRMYGTYQTNKQAEALAKEQKLQRDTVASYADKTYTGKKVMDQDISNKNKEEIVAVLKEAESAYQDRKAVVTVDGTAHTYSMKDLKEQIVYLFQDGTSYQAGDEESAADKLISMDKDLSVEEQYAIIKGKQAATEETVTIQCTYSKKGLNKVIEALKKKYVIPVTNAHIDAKGKISSTKDGQDLDTAQIKKELKAYLNNSELTDDFSGSYQTTVVEPTWTAKELKKVNTVISSFSTTFVSTTARGHNIKVGASRVNGICLLPGEKVSFDERVHDKSDGQSFQKANSYLKGQVVQTDGGGICQISTTAYNAILRAGILPSKRMPHSMPVSYVPLGLDAAISEGVKDLEITNTLDVPILILAKVKKNTLTFEIKSYKNALGEYSYKPRSEKLSSIKAKAYLDVYKNGKKEKSILLHTDTYQPHN